MGDAVSKREKIYLRVAKGSLIPADNYALSLLRERKYNTGDLLAADLVKPRNQKFNRLVHKVGQLVVANIEAFAGLEAHAAIKRLQWEGNIHCDEIGVSIKSAWSQVAAAILAMPGMQSIEPALKVVGSMLPEKSLVTTRHPRSLSFATMDEGEYQQAAKAICRLISERYWTNLTPEAIEEMASVMIED